MQPQEALQEQLYREIVGRMKETDLSVPVRQGDYFYYTRTEQGRQYSIYCRKRLSLERSRGTAARRQRPGRGPRLFPARRFRAQSRPSPAGVLHRFRRRRGLHHPRQGPAHRRTAGRIHRRRQRFARLGQRQSHVLLHHRGRGQAPLQSVPPRAGRAADDLVFHEADERFEVDLAKSKSRAYIFIDIFSHITTECRFLPADTPPAEFRVMLPRVQGVEYDAAHHGESFLHPHQRHGPQFPPGADSGRGAFAGACRGSAAASRGRDDRKRGRVPRSPGPGRARRGTAPARHREAVHRRAPPCRLSEPVYTVTPASNPEFDTPLLRFAYTSLITPLLGLRLRYGPPQPRTAASRSRCWAATTPRNTVPSASSPPRPMACACPFRWSTAKASSATAARPRCSTATARTAIQRAVVRFRAPEPAGPRLRLRHRPRSRRQRDGAPVVRRRQTAAQEKQLHGFRGLRRTPGRRAVHRRRTGWQSWAAAPADC